MSIPENEPEVRIASSPAATAIEEKIDAKREHPYLTNDEIKALARKDKCHRTLQQRINHLESESHLPTDGQIQEAWNQSLEAHIIHMKLLRLRFNRNWRRMEVKRLRLEQHYRMIEIMEVGQQRKIQKIRSRLGSLFLKGSDKGLRPAQKSPSRFVKPKEIGSLLRPPSESAPVG